LKVLDNSKAFVQNEWHLSDIPSNRFHPNKTYCLLQMFWRRNWC